MPQQRFRTGCVEVGDAAGSRGGLHSIRGHEHRLELLGGEQMEERVEERRREGR